MRKACSSCQTLARNNEIMREQAQRIAELKKEVNDLSVALEQYRGREAQTVEVIAFARQKADELTQDAKIKYALECQRLRVYREKWMRYIKDKNASGRLAQDIERTNELLKECQTQLEDMLYSDLGINFSVADSYICERERIDGEPILNYGAIIADAEKKAAAETISDEELEKMLEKLRS